LHGECSDKCADYCAVSCKSAFDTDTHGVGKKCFVGCSKKCFTRCVGGGYDVPDTVGRCDTPYCKLLKRTLLDMEGVFSQAHKWVEKVDEKAEISQGDAQRLLQEEPMSVLPTLDTADLSSSTDLTPEEIDRIMTGKSPVSMSSKSLSDSVLFDLSDADRDLLEKINGEK
jgi:hypothetical protein